MNMGRLLPWLLAPLLLGLSACRGVPEGLSVVQELDLERYLGRWYEIARLDHRFERGMSHVSADYSLRDDGSVRVINSGYKAKSAEWKRAEGKAVRDAEPPIGKFKVSFFGPFYGAYNVIKLDPEYRYAMIAGSDRGSFWLLSRDAQMPASVQAEWLAQAREWGFAVDEMILVEHDPSKAPPAPTSD